MRRSIKYLKIIIIFLISITLNSIVVNAENWKEWQDENYWEWHTRTTTGDLAYNGKHIVIQNNKIDFYGYWQNSYKDFLYKNYEKAGRKIFKFRIDETKANYHTLDGAGFIFNANQENNKLSGYVLLFREKDVCLYRLDNVDINTFEVTSNRTIANYGTLITSTNKTNSTIHDLIVEVTPTNLKITESENEILNVNLDYSIHTGESFGLISSYVQHACSILSKIEFSEIDIIVEDYKNTVLNTDLSNTPIQGGYFQLKNDKGDIIKEGTTDENGIFTIEGISKGIYTIQQTKVPEGYILNNKIYKFKVTEDGKIIDINNEKEIDLVITNEKYKIELSNNILNSNTPIQGAIIALYDENGKEIARATTDKEGKVIFDKIGSGKYTYKQIEVPNGYILNTNEYTCELKEDGTIEFNDNSKGIIYSQKQETKNNIDTDIDNNVNDSINNNINNNNINKDNTISTNKIPYAGEKIEIIKIVISIILISGIYIFVQIKKYKEVK